MISQIEKETLESKTYKHRKFLLFMIKRGLTIFFLLTIAMFFVSADTYEASDSDLTSGYTKELASGETIEFTLGIEEYKLRANTIYQNMIKIKISQNDPKFLGALGNANPSESK